MNCKKFREQFSDLVESKLSAARRESCEEHLSSCLDCLDFFIANDLQQLSNLVVQDSMSKRIIDVLSIDSCMEAEDQIVDFFDANLEEFERSLIQSHLTDCDSCRAMYLAYESLGAELCGLRERSPDVDQTEAILAKTLRRGQRFQRTFRIFSERFSGLIQRPRFSLEASMLGTLIWMLTFGVPAGALDREGDSFGVIAVIGQGAESAQRSLAITNANLQASFDRFQPLLVESRNAVEDRSSKLLREGIEKSILQGDELIRRLEERRERN